MSDQPLVTFILIFYENLRNFILPTRITSEHSATASTTIVLCHNWICYLTLKAQHFTTTTNAFTASTTQQHLGWITRLSCDRTTSTTNVMTEVVVLSTSVVGTSRWILSNKVNGSIVAVMPITRTTMNWNKIIKSQGELFSYKTFCLVSVAKVNREWTNSKLKSSIIKWYLIPNPTTET